MGYYTHYTLEAWKADTREQIDKNLEREIATRIGYLVFDTNRDWESFDEVLCDELKWYNNSEDMTLISKNYPNVVFLLRGTGEDYDDIWREWFHNGHSEYIHARLVFDIPQNDVFKGILVGEEL